MQSRLTAATPADQRLLHSPLSQVRLSKQLTELEKQFYGSSMAYDKAMQQGNEPLEKVGGQVPSVSWWHGTRLGVIGWHAAEPSTRHASWTIASRSLTCSAFLHVH